MNCQRIICWCGIVLLSGCTSWNLFSGQKSPPAVEKTEAELNPKYVGDLAVPFGMFPVSIEAVGLVTGLHGTGSDPEPSPQRDMLMDEMQRRGVKNPNRLLATRDVSLVLVRGVLMPGVQKGDRFDVEVHVPGRSETQSLRGGYLLETRLSDITILEGRKFDGKVRGMAEGPVLVDPSATVQNDRAILGRGLVPGVGLARQSRSIGLFLKNAEHLDMSAEQIRSAAVNSALVANAVNRRFHTFKHGIKVGVATAIRGNYVDLILSPQYRDNIERYMQVLRAIPLKETPAEQVKRLAELEKDLFDPSKAGRAAIQLEALGTAGINTLLKGIQSTDAEVRFYSAEALAYQNHREAAAALGDAARQQPAFRIFALHALSVLDDFTSLEQLRSLLDVPSVETRYGAFHAICKQRPDDPLVRGETLGKQFTYHTLDTQGPPLIHATRTRRAEIVVFGRNQQFLTPLSVNAGNEIMVHSTGNSEIVVSRFAANKADQKRTVSARIDDVIRAIADLGGTYPDVLQALHEAKAAGSLEGRFEVEALPQAGRIYERTPSPEGASTSDKTAKDKPSNFQESEKDETKP